MRRSNLRSSKSPDRGASRKKTGSRPTNRRLDPMANPMANLTIGVDLGDRYSELYVVDAAGACVETGRIRTTVAGLEQWFGGRPPAVRPALAPVLEQLQQLTTTIRGFDRAVEHRCAQSYPETARLRQVTGVGPVTALAYVVVLDDPTRFRRSRAVGAYLGLRPRRSQSGEQDPQLRITKAGNPFLRRLVVQAAHYILGPHGPDCDLRRHGERIAARGGKNAKKRAVIAVARKLAVLLHHLWISGAVYEPLIQRWCSSTASFRATA